MKRIISICIILLLFALTCTASAGWQDISVWYGATITVNNEAFTPTDANGNVVEPFIYEGTTYLPVRAVSEALGAVIAWDGVNNKVIIDKWDTSPSIAAKRELNYYFLAHKAFDELYTSYNILSDIYYTVADGASMDYILSSKDIISSQKENLKDYYDKLDDDLILISNLNFITRTTYQEAYYYSNSYETLANYLLEYSGYISELMINKDAYYSNHDKAYDVLSTFIKEYHAANDDLIIMLNYLILG